MSLWTCDEIVAATGGRFTGNVSQTKINGISIDSRTVNAGDAFFAIRGENFDGHDFVGAAARNGAAFAVVEEAKLPALGMAKIPMLVVADVLKALEDLGRAARDRSTGHIVAVTGSAGKTTVKEVLREVLSNFGSVHASPASFNNHWGVPLTLARLPRDAEFGIFEIGMNHSGEITPLVGMVRPHIAAITTIAAAHLGNFSSLDEIAEAKAEIFHGLVEGGSAIINGDVEQATILQKFANRSKAEAVVSFGKANDTNQAKLIAFELGPKGSSYSAMINGEPVANTTFFSGVHHLSNVLCVLSICDMLGIGLNAAADHLAKVRPGAGRGESVSVKIEGGSFDLIDESYNANPQAVEALIEVLSAGEPQKGGRRILVLGDMLEMGEYAQDVHAALAEPIGRSPIDKVFCAGDEMAHLAKALDERLMGGYAATTADLIGPLKEFIRAGDVVAIKASNGMKFDVLVDELKKAGK